MPDKERRRPAEAASKSSSVVGGGRLHGTRSPGDTCTFCGAPALEPNRADRRRGHPWVMVHASWCPTHSMGPVAHSTKWARS